MKYTQEPILIQGKCLSPGTAKGIALVAATRLSFWGGFDPVRGMITEVGNPLQGQYVKGKVLVFISTKGSSGTSNILNVGRHTGQLPAAFINTEIDSVSALGCLIQELPLITDLDKDPFEIIETGDLVYIQGNVQGGIARVEVYKKVSGE